MTVAHYGPLRVIYPTTGYDLDPTVYDPRRIWQLSAIDVDDALRHCSAHRRSGGAATRYVPRGRSAPCCSGSRS